MSLSTHWLDDVFGNVRDGDELLQTLVNSPELFRIAQQAIDAGEKQRKAFEQNPKLCSPSVAQTIRTEFLNRLSAQSLEEALATVP